MGNQQSTILLKAVVGKISTLIGMFNLTVGWGFKL